MSKGGDEIKLGWWGLMCFIAIWYMDFIRLT
jgi:hypothetical protein